MQGFLFSRPLPPVELEIWLRELVMSGRAPWIAANRSDRGGDALPPTHLLAEPTPVEWSASLPRPPLLARDFDVVPVEDPPVSSPMALD